MALGIVPKSIRPVRWRQAVGVTMCLSCICVAASCSEPHAIERLTIVNNTPFDVEVKVGDGTSQGWLILGRASGEASTLNQRVTDMGTTWVFEFEYARRVVDQLTVRRSDLERSGWRVEVPRRVETTMRRLGFEPPSER